jgi:hypothetical protein
MVLLGYIALRAGDVHRTFLSIPSYPRPFIQTQGTYVL